MKQAMRVYLFTRSAINFSPLIDLVLQSHPHTDRKAVYRSAFTANLIFAYLVPKLAFGFRVFRFERR